MKDNQRSTRVYCTHLGNVLATIQDRKQVGDTFTSSPVSGRIAYFIPYIVSTQDYYAFGSLMDERGFTGGCYGMDTTYRYGFQGQEKENDIGGNVGDYLSYKYRVHDARLGRFFSTDPLEANYVYQSTYVFSGNNPVALVDFLGMGVIGPPETTDGYVFGSFYTDEEGNQFVLGFVTYP